MVSSENKIPWHNHVAAAITALLSFLVYAFTAAPSVSVEDTGELIAAAYVLGIPHPTGYPLWTLLAHVWGLLFPFGEYAWRINIFSGFLASLALYFVVLTGIRLFGSRTAAMTASLLLAFSFEFWEQSIIAEVYALNSLGFILCICVLLIWSESRALKHLYGFTLIYGLSLTNHSTMFLAGPVFFGFILFLDRSWLKSIPTVAKLVGILVGTQFLWLYLPIRSAANPAMDWGNPETLSNFWKVFTRNQYQDIFSGEDRSWSRFAAQTMVFLRTYMVQFTILLFLLPVLGVISARKMNISLHVLLISLFIVIGFGAILIPNFNLEHQDVWLNTTYWIPCYILAALYSCAALAAGFRKLPRQMIAVGLGVLLVVVPLTFNYPRLTMRGYQTSGDFADAVYQTMEPDAVYIGSGDHTVFPVVYAQIVEGMRPDVTLFNPYGYPPEETLSAFPPDLLGQIESPPVLKKDNALLVEYLMKNEVRPVYSISRLPSHGRVVRKEGLLYRYYRPNEERGDSEIAYRVLDILAGKIRTHPTQNWSAKLTRYEVEKSKLEIHLKSDNTEEALRSLEWIERNVNWDKRALTNTGQVLARSRRYKDAQLLLNSALEIDRSYAPAVLNLARVYVEIDRNLEGVMLLKSHLKENPEDIAVAAYLKKIQRSP